MLAAAEQDRVPDGVDPTPGYAVHDLFVTWRPDDQRFHGARVDFGVSNIFDKDYRRNLSAIDDPGRTVKVAVSYRFRRGRARHGWFPHRGQIGRAAVREKV